MKIAVISDVHDNVWKLDEALGMMGGVDRLICCGDFCSPFTVVRMAKGFTGLVHAVFGNNDGDRRMLQIKADGFATFMLYGEFAEIEEDSLKIAITHYPDIAEGLAAGDNYDLICYGHNHQKYMGKVGKTILLNPGELCGILTGDSTFAVFDTETREVAFHGIR